MHMAVIDTARNLAGLSNAHTHEIQPDTLDPVISLLDEQRQVVDKGGTMRLGAQPCRLAEGSRAREAYGTEVVLERHRHRYELNPAYRDLLEQHGLRVTGDHEENGLAEIVERPDHPWFVAVQFHPEFRSKPTSAHPLFHQFVGAALRHGERHHSATCS